MKQFLVLLCLVISLLWIGGNRGLATTIQETAPVVVDGEIIFNIGPIGYFTANERAKAINEVIAAEIRSTPRIKLEVSQVEDKGVIQLQGRQTHLLTVNPSDVINGVDAFTQAQLWRDRLERAMLQAQLARSPKLVWRRTWFSIGVVWGASQLSISINT